MEGFRASQDRTFPLSLEEIKISGNSVSAAVCVFPQDLRVSDKLAEAVLSLRPTLAEHTCKHERLGYFGDSLAGTTLPHLVEHLAIDFLVEENLRCAQTGPVYNSASNSASTSENSIINSVIGSEVRLAREPSQAVAGTTNWIDRDQGRMQVRISCTAQSADETCTAIRRAITLVNSLLEE